MRDTGGRAGAAQRLPEAAERPPGAGRRVPWSYASTVEIGRGRSGVVYRGRDAEGRELACKVFGAGGLTKLVQWVLLGAPNPYLWCEDAVRCAALRREILAELVPAWLGDRLRVADARGVAWHAEQRAFELATDFVDGRPAALHHPRRMRGHDEVRDLTTEVLRPLRARLAEAGLDGLLWQAGEGNPVALNNFLRERDGAATRWAWIDLESGVPALFPLDPRALVRTYLPLAWRWRRAPFDDVDVERLRAHLREPAVRAALGEPRAERLEQRAAELGRHQDAWKGLPRHVGAIRYQLARGRLTAERAAWYEARPVRWYAREVRRAVRAAPGAVRALARVPWGPALRAVPRFLTSQRFRYALARRHVAGRLRAWELRGQMDPADAAELRAQLVREESSAYLTDFGVHLAIKPFVKAVEYWLFPTLFAFGVVGEGTLALVLLTAGAIARSVYTLGRVVQCRLHGRRGPWTALVVGTLPVVGNFAYPLQLAWSSTGEEEDLARFILHDGFARLGAHVPIWGGRDTATEHWMNRLPEHLFRLRRPASVAAAPEDASP